MADIGSWKRATTNQSSARSESATSIVLAAQRTVQASTQALRSLRRYRIARPARTKGGPVSLIRQPCSVRTDRRRKSAASSSVKSISRSVGLTAACIGCSTIDCDGDESGSSWNAKIGAAIYWCGGLGREGFFGRPPSNHTGAGACSAAALHARSNPRSPKLFRHFRRAILQ